MLVLRFQKIKGCEHRGNSDPHRRIGNVSSRAYPEVTVGSDHVQKCLCLPSSETEGKRRIILSERTIFLDESFRFELEWFRVGFLVVSKAPAEAVRGPTMRTQ